MSDKDTQLPFGEQIQTGTSDSVLSSLYRIILMETGITLSRFNKLLEQYIVRANIPSNTRDVSTLRGNIKKQLMKSEMSWSVFVKGLVFLNVKRFEIKVTLQHSNGKVTEHTRSVLLDTDDITNPSSDTNAV